MKVNNRQLRLLQPYLEGQEPTHTNKKGEREWNMHCPLHQDSKRSASLNVDKGEWYCFAGCGGGRVTELIKLHDRWLPPNVAATNGGHSRKSTVPERLSLASVGGWHSALLSNDAVLEEFLGERGLTTDTVIKYQIGWDVDRRCYTIPIFDQENNLCNVRRYMLHPPEGWRKIWGLRGHNAPMLYPMSVFTDSPAEIAIVEGELDALITIQNGYPAITRTGAADVWKVEWGSHFKGRKVYLAHDCDKKGQIGNRKVGRSLFSLADVRILKLPYPVTDKHGKDMTDFWMEHDRVKYERLLAEAEPFRRSRRTREMETITVLDSFDSQRVGEPVRVIVTVKGRKDPGYSVPQRAKLVCTRDAGTKCQFCPLNAAGGEATLEISKDDPLILKLLDATSNQVHDILRETYGAVKCNKLVIETEDHLGVEVLFGRPSIDHSDGTEAGSYKNIRITSVGRHDTAPNTTVGVVGALHPSPRTQQNEFMAWEVEQLETSVDRFEITPEAVRLMKRFAPRKGQRPLRKLSEINRELAAHVTRIVGRPEMHAVMDLTFHSALSFKFGGQLVHRGWLEALVVGDTQQGKSETARGLVRHYGAGEVVSCESASFAGVVGGLQQLGGKDWAVTWGSIPINDRRLVVLEEISGLSQEEISQMSEVRSSGLAKLTKIQQEATHSRTRLIWVGNPRAARMSDFTYGVDAIRPLIGNAEDIARFDLALSVALGEVDAAEINQPHDVGELKYTSEACHTLLMWAWTRQMDQVFFTPAAEREVYKAARAMGAKYVEEPPLVQVANVRIKIARVSVALAARLFSTDDNHDRIVVKPEHVQDAVAFMNHLYALEGFGYAERSREIIADTKEAQKNSKAIIELIKQRRGLGKFLRGSSRFRRQDLEEILNASREEANAIINKLWEARMVRKEGGDIRVEPTLHSLLREVK